MNRFLACVALIPLCAACGSGHGSTPTTSVTSSATTADATSLSAVEKACTDQVQTVARSSVGGDYEHTVSDIGFDSAAFYGELPQGKAYTQKVYDVLMHYTVTPGAGNRGGSAPVVENQKCRYDIDTHDAEIMNRDEGGSLG